MTNIDVQHTVAGFRAACDAARARGARLGLVPTMGALHRGHLALVEEALRHTPVVAVTIFVNPTQFGPNEDFARYPRTLPEDIAACASAGAAIVFAPDASEMYPPGERTRVTVSALGDSLCGPRRPGHFQGVATIVAKLFAVAGPCRAVFGRKDYQQLKIIERMAKDLLLPVTVVGSPTVRDEDGLALSSRNRYLSEDERERARAIPRALSEAVRRFAAGERAANAIIDPVRAALQRAGLRLDYADVAHPDELTPFEGEQSVGERALVAVAAFSGTTRLIDNVVLGEDAAPLDSVLTVGAAR